MNSKKNYLKLLIATLVVTSYQVTVVAQTTSSVLLEEVQVFGTKQGSSQAAQDVPLQISAFDGAKLDALKVVTMEDLSFSMPNVSLDQIGTFPGVANFAIRGLGVNSSAASIDPAVGLFVDGVYMGVNFGSVIDTFDLESVEVLRGPQGVLFGRNVTGGAILLRTARPTPGDGFKAKVKAGYETEDQLTISGSVENSLSDSLAVKLAVYNSDDGGYFHNSFLGRDVGEQETQLIKFATVWQPSEDLEFTLLYEDGSMDGQGAVLQFPNATPLTPNDKVEVRQGNSGENDQTWDRLMIETNWDIGPGRLTNIFGRRNLDVFSIVDVDAAPDNTFDADTRIGHEQTSNELRYNFDASDNWNVTLGAYWYEADLKSFDGRWLRMFGADGTQGGLLRGGGGGDQIHTVEGLFWNNQVALSDGLGLTLGVRYTSEEKKDVGIYGLSYSGANACDTTTSTCADVGPQQNVSWSNVTPKIGMQWAFSEDTQVYAHFTKGFRSGGFDVRSGGGLAGTPYDEENTDNFELGIKSTFNDGSVRFNAALFHSTIDDVQRTSFFNDESGTPQQLTRNVADAVISGVEMDFTALVTESLVVSFNAGFLDASYDNVYQSFDPSLALKEQEDLQLARAPEFTFSTSVNYDLAITDSGILSSRIAYSFRDTTFYDDRNLGKFPSYSILNVGFTYSPSVGDWDVSLYGKNLLDTAILGGVVSLPSAFYPGTDGGYLGGLGKGQRWGLEFSYRFE